MRLTDVSDLNNLPVSAQHLVFDKGVYSVLKKKKKKKMRGKRSEGDESEERGSEGGGWKVC